MGQIHVAIRRVAKEDGMESAPDMRYVALDVDLKARRIRVGSCVMWAAAIIVLAWTGHILLGVPAALPSIWKWWRG
jgi:hypothetical protein